jgi:hypothetical protein
MCNKVKTRDVFWVGEINVCQLCNGGFDNDVMYDANIGGRWGNVCCWCFDASGARLGIGLGQKYKLTDGKWLLVEGNK